MHFRPFSHSAGTSVFKLNPAIQIQELEQHLAQPTSCRKKSALQPDPAGAPGAQSGMIRLKHHAAEMAHLASENPSLGVQNHVPAPERGESRRQHGLRQTERRTDDSAKQKTTRRSRRPEPSRGKGGDAARLLLRERKQHLVEPPGRETQQLLPFPNQTARLTPGLAGDDPTIAGGHNLQLLHPALGAGETDASLLESASFLVQLAESLAGQNRANPDLGCARFDLRMGKREPQTAVLDEGEGLSLMDPPSNTSEAEAPTPSPSAPTQSPSPRPGISRPFSRPETTT